MKVMAEYIWLDGLDEKKGKKTQELRSKTRIVDEESVKGLDAGQMKEWAFDGSSTYQAGTEASDCRLKPIKVVLDPFRGHPNVLVLCEVLNMDGTPHVSNTRARLRAVTERYKDQEPLFGIEQEYTLLDVFGKPYRWPLSPEKMQPQGPYYCGVGANLVFGREIYDEHLKKCLEAGLTVAGGNGEVMPSQWEFQIGPLGPEDVGDEMQFARYILQRVAERYYSVVSLSPKPMAGDWNGAGGHTNFSTKAMREEDGLEAIKTACLKLSKRHSEHIKVYGEGNEKRLTGKHETCGIGTFKWAVGHRGASVRIPAPVAKASCGYLEDRRPAANLDPYLVCTAILETVCGEGFTP